jgi:sodium--glutamate symport carrier gltS
VLIVGILVLFLGNSLTRRIEFLRRYSIVFMPPVSVSGFTVSPSLQITGPGPGARLPYLGGFAE